MKFTPEYEAQIFRRPSSDDDRYNAWCGHLPIRDPLTPYHAGPHSIRAMELAYKICGRPKRIFEIGFCLGHSASIWFGLGAKHVTSVENSSRPQTIEAAGLMGEKWGDKFRFLNDDRIPELRGIAALGVMDEFDSEYHLAFIDGGHDFADVDRDIKLCLSLGVPWLVLDDIGEKWGPGVEPAIHANKLEFAAIIGNLAVCRPHQKEWDQL